MKEITIDIDRQGNTTIEATGFAGGECKDLTRGIEEALGETKSVKLKPEYRQSAPKLRKAGV